MSTIEKHVPKGQIMLFVERCKLLEEWKYNRENLVFFSPFPTKDRTSCQAVKQCSQQSVTPSTVLIVE
jgi:hypothetical protein